MIRNIGTDGRKNQKAASDSRATLSGDQRQRGEQPAPAGIAARDRRDERDHQPGKDGFGDEGDHAGALSRLIGG
jgi:hypothetical protein